MQKRQQTTDLPNHCAQRSYDAHLFMLKKTKKTHRIVVSTVVFPLQPRKVTQREMLKKGKRTEMIRPLKQRGREKRNTKKN